VSNLVQKPRLALTDSASMGTVELTSAAPARKPQRNLVTIQLSREDYQRVLDAALSSGQTVSEWIEDMCRVATTN